jgi:hypothetical protein
MAFSPVATALGKQILAIAPWVCLSLLVLSGSLLCKLSSLKGLRKDFIFQFAQLFVVIRMGDNSHALCVLGNQKYSVHFSLGPLSWWREMLRKLKATYFII